MLLRLQNGSAVLHSGIDILRFSICIGRDEPFGAKPRGAYTPVRGLAGISYEFDLPLHDKLTSFSIKQFFRFSKEHQTLTRSRLRRFLLFIADALQLQKVRLAAFAAPSG